MKYHDAWEALRDWLEIQGRDDFVYVQDVMDKINELEEEYE